MSIAFSERTTLPWVIQWGTWPLLFATNLLVITHAVTFGWNLGLTLGALIVTFAVILVALEFAYPLDKRWRMTWRTFLGRDIKYFLAGGLTGATVNAAIGILGLSLAAGHRGPMTDWPLWLAVPTAIIGFDFFQYWQHRWSHEANTSLKRLLWKTHVQHHLPEQVYVLMHPAGHPMHPCGHQAHLFTVGIELVGVDIELQVPEPITPQHLRL